MSSKISQKKFQKAWWVAGVSILAVGIIVTSLAFLKTSQKPAGTSKSSLPEGWTYQAGTVCSNAGFPMPPRQKSAGYWKLYTKDTTKNPPSMAKIFSSEVGSIYGNHDSQGANQAAVDIQCASSTSTLTQLFSQYQQASGKPAISSHQDITKWNQPTAMLKVASTTSGLSDDTIYLVATGHNVYLIQAVTVSGAPTTVTNDTATILDRLKIEQ
jgi:hypothetical protein